MAVNPWSFARISEVAELHERIRRLEGALGVAAAREERAEVERLRLLEENRRLERKVAVLKSRISELELLGPQPTRIDIDRPVYSLRIPEGTVVKLELEPISDRRDDRINMGEMRNGLDPLPDGSPWDPSRNCWCEEVAAQGHAPHCPFYRGYRPEREIGD